MIVRPVPEVPEADVTRQSMSRVKASGKVHCLFEPTRVLPACNHPEPSSGRVQIVTTSPGTATPVSAWVVPQCAVRGPATVGGKVARMDTAPVTADAYEVVTRHDSVDPAASGTGSSMLNRPLPAAVFVATVVKAALPIRDCKVTGAGASPAFPVTRTVRPA